MWNAPWPKINVRYRNVTNVWFRAVAWEWSDFLNKRRSRPEYLNDRDRAECGNKRGDARPASAGAARRRRLAQSLDRRDTRRSQGGNDRCDGGREQPDDQRDDHRAGAKDEPSGGQREAEGVEECPKEDDEADPARDPEQGGDEPDDHGLECHGAEHLAR